MSDETKKKLSTIHKNKIGEYTDGQRDSLGRFAKGIKQPSRPVSAETKNKIRFSLLGRKRPNWKSKGKNHWNWKGGYIRKLFNCKQRRALKRGASGSHTLGEWENLKAQYNWTCPACLKKESVIKLSEDHIIPLIRGGSNNIENIQPLCKSCNSKKAIKIIKYPILNI